MPQQLPKTSLPLDSVCEAVASELPESEYLVERHSIIKGESYVNIIVNAKWLTSYETIGIEVIFQVNSDQSLAMKAYIDDENIVDDIDSGVGELFESALHKKYPDYDWSYPIGKISIKCKKVK
jgi:hypothetical protein